MKNFILFTITFCILASCGSLKEAGKVLRNEKINTNDEFLVKKNDPLVLPPNYEEIPEPGSAKNEKKEEDEIKKMLKAPKQNNTTKNKSSSVEESILNRIRK